MSTRRARIKAVASLPVRRKNADNKDGTKKDVPAPKSIEPEKTTGEESLLSTSSGTEQTPTAITKTPLTPKLQAPNTAKLIKPSPPQRTLSPFKAQINLCPPLSPAVIRNTPRNDRVPNKPQTPTPITSAVELKNTVPISHKTVVNIKDNSDVLDGIAKITDFNPPSVPESITKETILDGIVPLNSAQKKVPKPLDLLKNEIISENAEVLFDPIVPLPSPSKVRPKLRPVPRLPMRRNSIQGSASESEDESRRALLIGGSTTPAPQRQRHDSQTSHRTQLINTKREPKRVRSESVCSTLSQATPQVSQVGSTLLTKDKQHLSKSRRNEMSRRMTAMRRRLRGQSIQRETLTMYDLIFYNPTTNPIIPNEEEKQANELMANEKNKKQETESVPKVANKEEEESVDDPQEEELDAAPAPQIKLGPNGEIIIDEKSLVIKQTEDRKLSDSVVREGDWVNGGRGKYTRSRRAPDWSDAETVRFYRALAAIGTEFTLMESLFPGRSRRELKVKFKKEEKINRAQVDKALSSHMEWDVLTLEEEFNNERRLAAEKAAKEKAAYLEAKKAEKARFKACKAAGSRLSQGAKTVEMNVQRSRTDEAATAHDLIKNTFKTTEKKKAPQPKATAQTTAKLNIINQKGITIQKTPQTDLACMSRLTPEIRPSPPNIANVPKNIENGSLVVLTVNDPNDPTKKMLQTYISRNSGQLTPVALPPNILSSVVSYMKNGTPKLNASPQLTSPSSVASQESRSSVIQINPSPTKRQRHSSYNITQL